jgi:hypothetical protein
VGQASVATRMRTGDIRSVPLAFWLFGFLTLLYAYLLVTDMNRSTDFMFQNLPSYLVFLAPLAFATAVAWAAPVDLRYLWGAAFIAASEMPSLIEMALARFASVSFDWGIGLRPQSFAWGLELIGVALIALAIGRIQQRRNLLWPALGLAVFVIGDIENAAFWASNPYPEEEFGFVYPITEIAITFVAGLTIVAWSYLLGAAVEHGRRLFALGSGIFVALSAFGLFDELVFALAPATPDQPISPLFPVFAVTGIVNLLGWVAMIAAALREVPRRRAAVQLADSAS